MNTYSITIRDNGVVQSCGNTPKEAFERVFPSMVLISSDDAFNANVCIELVGGKRQSISYYIATESEKSSVNISDFNTSNDYYVDKIKRGVKTKKKQEERQRELKEQQERQELVFYKQRLLDLRPRMNDLIQLINVCYKERVLPYLSGYDISDYTNGMFTCYHHIYVPRSKEEKVGWVNIKGKIGIAKEYYQGDCAYIVYDGTGFYGVVPPDEIYKPEDLMVVSPDAIDEPDVVMAEPDSLWYKCFVEGFAVFEEVFHNWLEKTFS